MHGGHIYHVFAPSYLIYTLIKARKYTDARCMWYSKPLLESGTTGTKSNHEVILPFRTNTYNDGVEPPELAIAMCTLKSFPFLPLHCIEFAKQAMFSETFDFGPTQYQAFRTNKSTFFDQMKSMSTDAERFKAMKAVETLVTIQGDAGGSVDFKQCIHMAFLILMSYFRHKILDVVNAGDKKQSETGDYWAGTKRRPQPVDFNPDKALAMEFLYATANLYAYVFQVDYLRDRAAFDSLVRSMNLSIDPNPNPNLNPNPEPNPNCEGYESLQHHTFWRRMWGRRGW